MSSIKLKHASGNGVSISAPSSNPASDRTLTLPGDADGIIAKTDSSGNFNVAGNLTVASGSDTAKGASITGGASGGTDIADFRTNNGTIRMKINNDVTISTGNLVIGTSGKGIDFSATGDGSGTDTSELLDDYEEGTWTPTVTGGTIISSGAYYTKIGRVVHWYLYGYVSNTANDGATFKINGLPYNVGGNSTGLQNYYGNVGSLNYTSSANNAGLQRLAILAHGATDYIYFHFVGAGDPNPPVNSYWHSNMLNQSFIIAGSYFI